MYLVSTTILYLLVNTPRTLSNGFILAIAPPVAISLFVFEFALAILLSHKYINNIRDNEVVPGGLLLAITNAMSPTGPIGKIGVINCISCLVTICKLGFVYIIITYLDQIHWLLSDTCDQPDLFRCFLEEDFIDAGCPFNVTNTSSAIVSPRICEPDEIRNGKHNVVISTIVIFTLGLVMISIPSGFLITFLIRRKKLKNFHENVSKLKNAIIPCKKEPKCEATREESDISEGSELYEFETHDGHDEARLRVEFDEENIENPVIILRDIRRVFGFPVKIQEQGNNHF